ncbi:MAG: phosphatidylserine decarboxylase [Planctomycetes bacterium]|nr:phosphatidylserine decarboxylase [Planctomycetota bacterium]
MRVSRYGAATCALQVGTLLALGAAAAGAAVALGHPALAWSGVVPVALGLFVLSFYRDPERQGPTDPDLWVSPADGVVTDIATVDEPHFIGGKALRVGIFLSPLNVHVNRSPVAGVVEAVVPRPGLCLPATGPACIDQNESTLLGLRTDAGLRVGVRQVTGALARTIVCAATPGQRLARGERYGMIKLGSRTEVLVPADAGFAPAVALGQAVRGGETVIGRLGVAAGAAGAERDEQGRAG